MEPYKQNISMTLIQVMMSVLCRWPLKAVAMNTKRGIAWNPAHKYLQMTNIVVPGWQSHQNIQVTGHVFLYAVQRVNDLEQPECLPSKDTPHRLMITHTIIVLHPKSKEDKFNVTNLPKF